MNTIKILINSVPFRKTLGYVLLILIEAGLLGACQGNTSTAKAPDFMLLNLKNEVVTLSDYKGKVVLINFFATHCPPCRLEIPDFVRLQNHYGPRGFVVIGISVDQNGEDILPGFVKALKINYPVLLATSRVIKDYGNVYALPASFLIDRDHRIIKHYIGMVTRNELEPLIVKALGSKD